MLAEDIQNTPSIYYGSTPTDTQSNSESIRQSQDEIDNKRSNFKALQGNLSPEKILVNDSREIKQSNTDLNHARLADINSSQSQRSNLRIAMPYGKID